jgi:hypothetical protein
VVTPPEDNRTDSPPTNVSDILAHHRDNFLPIFAYATASERNMSVQILNEIRNCLDHLARADTGKNAEKNIEKAKNHIDRACLDCVKVAWIAFSRDVYKTYDSFTPKQYMMLEEGAYWKKVGLLYEAFQEKSFQARKSEPINLDTDIDTAISDYFDAIAAGKELMETVKAK